jgi:hypothetical protein
MKLDLRNKLSLSNWEQALRKFPFTAQKGWSKELRDEGLQINLSKVGWVEPVAALRLVLFVEAALISGLRVTVNLPLPMATRAEQRTFELASSSKDLALHKKAKNIGLNIRRRLAASFALRDLRFKEALSHEHLHPYLDALTIVEKHDWSTLENDNDFELRYNKAIATKSHEDFTPSWNFEVVYGLQWIPDPRSDEGRKIIDHLAEIDILASILTHPSLRVSAADGATLAHVFLKELVENSFDHSGREFALIAALRRPRGYNLKEEEIYECERNFALWCRNYPLIEVMVGDSGCGIPKSLVGEYRKKRPPAPEKLKESSVNTRILAWAFDKWSSKSSSDSKRGTRGLYRAERIVRKYDGCITLRSESSYVGVESGSNDPADYIFEQSLPKVHGTVVHVRLPVIPSEKIPDRPSNPALHKAHIEVVDFHNLDWRKTDRTLELVCEELHRRSEGKSSSRRPTCLILDFGLAKLERRTLEQLLLRLVEIAHPVALVVANVKAPSADSASETIHSIAEQIAPPEGSNVASAEFREANKVRDAILFQYSDGSFAWVGSPPTITEHLNRLWQNERIGAEELASEIPDAAKRNDLIRQFAEAYHVAHRDKGGGIALNFNQEDISESLQLYMCGLLRDKIRDGRPPAVLTGKFRTPSLEIVSKYIKVKGVLEEIGLDRATASLARKCAVVPFLQQADSLHLVADWKTSRDVLESFRDNLSALLRFPKNSFLISQLNAGQVPDIEEDSHVILFTDVILAGDLLTSLIAQIVRARRAPTLIAAALDARAEGVRGNPLTVMGRPINVVSIADVDIWLKSPAKASEPINISPITHEPEVNESEQDSDYAIAADVLRKMIEEEDAIYFDHIVRPNGRHFCFYLDPFKLLGALDTDDPSDLSEHGRTVIDTFALEIDGWLGGDDNTIDVIYFPNLPRSERPSPTKLLIGQKLSERYRARLTPISSLSDVTLPQPELSVKQRFFQYTSPRSFGRSLQSSLFDSPTSVTIDSASPHEGNHEGIQRALIIDWGSITGTAIRAAIRYAAARGANKILVIALLSQLSLDEERFLASLTQIEVTEKKNNQIRVRDCEVRVKFLARYPIQVYEPRLCPYCRQLDRLEEEERFYPTKLLAEFIRQAKHRLRPRFIEGDEGVRVEYQQRRLGSLGGGSIDDADASRNVTTIAELRNQLEAAKLWTHSRWKLYQDISQLEDPLDRKSRDLRVKRGCWVRLLAVEWLWLKQEPLSMIKFKRQISKLAINVIKDRYCSEEEKLDAIVVLRTASKDAFAQSLPQIFNAIIDDDKITESQTLSLISQLLYCAFTYLQRDYLMAATLQPLVDALSETASRVHELLGKRKQTTALRVGRTVNSLQQYGRFLLHSLNHITAPEAWRRLKRELGPQYHIHFPVCVAFDSLRFGALEEDIEKSVTPPKINWVTKRKSWEQKCVPFIIDTLLPLLAPLREVFEGLDARIMVGENRAETLAITERKLFRDLATLSQSLMVFAKTRTAVQQPRQWRDFVQARDSIWTLLIDPGRIREGNFREGGSSLVRMLQDCPADVLSVTKELIEGRSFRGNLDIHVTNALTGSSSLVFCHTDVLGESVLELLRNVSRHVQNSSKGQSNELPAVRTDDPSIPVEIHISEDENYIRLSIRNEGILIESDIHGRGLEMCAERLRPYGALVETEQKLPGAWVFGVKLQFLKG